MGRGLRTLGLYGTFGCLGYLLTGLGAILPELRSEYGLPRGEAALYPSGFAVGLVVLGLAGPRMARRLGPYALPLALAALVGGAFVLTLDAGRAGAAAGALLLGFGGAGLVQLVPAELQAAHRIGHSDGHSGGRRGGHAGRRGDGGTVAIGEANAVASSASVLAPLLIGGALGVGLGWRIGFAGPPLLVAAVLLAVLVRRGRAAPPDQTAGESAGRAPRAFWGWWLDIVLAVAVEFCMLLWSVDFLRSVTGLAPEVATAASAAFVLGMALGRSVISRVVRLAGGSARLLMGAAGLALAGFALYWAVPVPAVAVTGLLLIGLGVALLYPVALSEALAAWPERPTRAAARCALASGVAIGSVPPLLGALADQAGLRTASLLAAVLLAVLLVRSAHRGRTARRVPVPTA